MKPEFSAMISLVFTVITTAFIAPSAWCQSQLPTIGLKSPIADEQNPHALVFRERDKDSDGILSVNEYITGAGRDRKTLHREFKVFDADADGRMSLNEFLTVPVGQPENQRGVIDDPVIQLAAKRQGELMKLWEKWDTNKDGLLDKPEFESAKLGLMVPGLESAGFTKWDQDVDGMISRDDVTRTLEVAYPESPQQNNLFPFTTSGCDGLGRQNAATSNDRNEAEEQLREAIAREHSASTEQTADSSRNWRSTSLQRQTKTQLGVCTFSHHNEWCRFRKSRQINRPRQNSRSRDCLTKSTL